MDFEKIENNLQNNVTILKAFSNEHRLRVMCLLYQGEHPVGALEKKVGLSLSALSQHLARLRRDGLVKTRRDAQTVYYSANASVAQPILESLCKL